MIMTNPVTFCTWKAEFALGLPEVDAEHQRFFEIMNELHGAMLRGNADAQVASTLCSLTAYATNHFEHEERALAEVGYPQLHVQRKQHQWFLAQMQQLALSNRESSRGALSFMKDWLVEHILGTDKKYAVWIAAQAHLFPSGFHLESLARRTR